MDGKRLIKSISLKNFLSYGSEGMTLELEPLNVLIGANGSGKSNLIEAIRILHATPKDITLPIIDGGGVDEWVWKGGNNEISLRYAGITATVIDDGSFTLSDPFEEDDHYIVHKFAFSSYQNRIHDVIEQIDYKSGPQAATIVPIYFARYGEYLLWRDSPEANDDGSIKMEYTPIKLNGMKKEQSVISQRRDPDSYPSITYLAERYENIKLYTDTSLGRFTPARKAQDALLDQSFLLEDGSNLALVLNNLQNRPETKRRIIEKLKLFNDRVEDFNTNINFGLVQVYLQEQALRRNIPATRLSDGTLRYICLLVILCHPNPPPLICIEEPELGMHPDIIPTIAELLVEASKRTQLIVTTHSEMLISALSHVPEAIIVCERDDKGSTLRRLEAEPLKEWLEKYTLGDLWMKGELGGTRW